VNDGATGGTYLPTGDNLAAASSSVVGGKQEYIDRDRLCFNVAF
jgi:hypothetical protein